MYTLLLCVIVYPCMVLMVINILCLCYVRNVLILDFSFLLFLGKCEAYILPVFTCLVSRLCIAMHLAKFRTTGFCVPLFFSSLCSGLDCCVGQMCRIPPAPRVLYWKHISKGSDSGLHRAPSHFEVFDILTIFFFYSTLNISRKYEVPLLLGMHNMFYINRVHNKFYISYWTKLEFFFVSISIGYLIVHAWFF